MHHYGTKCHGDWKDPEAGRPPPVAGVPAENQRRGARDAVGGEHRAEQQRAALLGEHVPRQGHRVAGVAEIGRELPRHQEPEAAVPQREVSVKRLLSKATRIRPGNATRAYQPTIWSRWGSIEMLMTPTGRDTA
jgi:hypothetical protein